MILIKFVLDGVTQYAEVLYYFFVEHKALRYTLAAVKMYSPPDPQILEETYSTTKVCTHLGDDGVKIVDVKWIHEVVAMIPFTRRGRDSEYYLLEDMHVGQAELCSEAEGESI
jgi:hypothetical protein